MRGWYSELVVFYLLDIMGFLSKFQAQLLNHDGLRLCWLKEAQEQSREATDINAKTCDISAMPNWHGTCSSSPLQYRPRRAEGSSLRRKLPLTLASRTQGWVEAPFVESGCGQHGKEHTRSVFQFGPWLDTLCLSFFSPLTRAWPWIRTAASNKMADEVAFGVF